MSLVLTLSCFMWGFFHITLQSSFSLCLNLYPFHAEMFILYSILGSPIVILLCSDYFRSCVIANSNNYVLYTSPGLLLVGSLCRLFKSTSRKFCPLLYNSFNSQDWHPFVSLKGTLVYTFLIVKSKTFR